MPSVASHLTRARNSGTWKSWSNFWARHAGVWKKPLSVFVRRNGVWVKVWDERPVFVTTNTTYFEDTNTIPVTTTYYKTGTFNANGFSTTLTASTTSQFGVIINSPNPTTVAANSSNVNFSVETYEFGYYNAAYFPTVTITNASGSATF